MNLKRVSDICLSLTVASLYSGAFYVGIDNFFCKIISNLAPLQMSTGQVSSLYGHISELCFYASIVLSIVVGVMVYKLSYKILKETKIK